MLAFPFREIPTVTPFPRNDKQYRRERRLIRTDVIKTNVHPYRIVIARSATRDVAISRKGNVGNVHAPAHSPARAPCLVCGGSPPYTAVIQGR